MKIDLTSDFTNKDMENIIKLANGEAENEAELIESYNKFINCFGPKTIQKQSEYINILN
jgi:hypothetical protein